MACDPDLGGIVDLHSHVLPGVDDGARDLDAALAMARIAVAEGITTMVATPHTMDGVYDVSRLAARAAHAELCQALAAAHIPLDLRLGGEVHLHQGLPDLLRQEPDLAYDDGGRFFLLELPHQSVPSGLPEFVFRLRTSGVTPIIAHPERNLTVRDDPEITAEWLRLGVLLQVTAGSLVGTFGPLIGDCARTLLAAGRVHVLATDCHSCRKRPPKVQEAIAAAAAIVGASGARALLVDNPGKILRGATASSVVPAAPVGRPRRKRRLFSWGRA